MPIEEVSQKKSSRVPNLKNKKIKIGAKENNSSADKRIQDELLNLNLFI